MGLVSALVYLLAIVVFLPFAFKRDIVEATSGGGHKDVVVEAQHVETGRFLHRFPLEKLASYGFAYGTIATVIILGFIDDTFDIRWRHKFFIPAFASLPTLGLYFIDFGVTHVVVPLPLRPYLGEIFDLGKHVCQTLHASVNRRRCALLSIHVGHLHLLSEQYQHRRRSERH